MENDTHQLLSNIAASLTKLTSDVAVMSAKFDEHKFGLKIWTDTKDVEVKEIRAQIAAIKEYHAGEEGKKAGIKWVAGSIGFAVSLAVTLIGSIFSGVFHR